MRYMEVEEANARISENFIYIKQKAKQMLTKDMSNVAVTFWM